MDIGAFIAPSSGFLDTYSNANFSSYNLVLTEDSFADETAIAKTKNTIEYAMNKCAELGLDVQIQLHHSLIKANFNVFTEYLSDVNFKDYPAFTGFYLLDEPSWTQIDVLNDTYVDWFNNNYGDSDYEFYVNMLGGYSSYIGAIRDENGDFVLVNGNKIYSGTEEQERICYDAYVKKFLQMFSRVRSNNKYFTIDHYPLLDNQVGLLTKPGDELPEGYERLISENWLATNYMAANNAKNNDLTFGAFILSCDEGGTGSTRRFRLITNVEEIKWQAYINIAFGAKRLTYYGYDNSTGGTYMTLNGNPLDMYYLVQETNAELDLFDHVIASFTEWVGVKTFLGENSTSNASFDKISEVELSSLTGVSNVNSSRDLIVGEMVDENGNHGYMMVGFDDPYNKNETEVSMTFDGAEGLIIYRNGQRTLSEDLTDGNFNVTLSAGEGVFVIPVYAE